MILYETIYKINDKPTLQQVAWRLGRYMAAYHDDVSHQDIIVPPRSQQQIGKLFICHTTQVKSLLNCVF
jgi:acetone carboxylase gamma subunit